MILIPAVHGFAELVLTLTIDHVPFLIPSTQKGPHNNWHRYLLSVYPFGEGQLHLSLISRVELQNVSPGYDFSNGGQSVRPTECPNRTI